MTICWSYDPITTACSSQFRTELAKPRRKMYHSLRKIFSSCRDKEKTRRYLVWDQSFVQLSADPHLDNSCGGELQFRPQSRAANELRHITGMGYITGEGCRERRRQSTVES